ncbi:hypothetical protein PHMEG_00016549 [Phytophthora megakarya]|uniref:Uncharacterized protein n=1 Tax=Phytophthora megakarya TaxID=4795 RepID=A0A225VYR8_9STRA|nr:hypothetical protein PHMEG_00016549 [Phytophthora megakarya]
MLPKLSEKRSVKFQAADVEPAFVSARRNALQQLKMVTGIRVSCIGKGRYAVEVFTDSSASSNSLGNALTCQDEFRSQQPALRTERELFEFIDLRDKVYNSVYSAHTTQYCRYCSGILEAVVNGVDPGGVFFTVFGEGRATRKLTQFMQDLQMRTVQHVDGNVRGCCSAQMLVPELVHGFLFKSRASTTAA